MGLIKSYNLEKKKVCVYNTIDGQEEIILGEMVLDCPLKVPEILNKN